MAKKILYVIALMFALVYVLASCGCDHEWTTQTCEEGVHCTKCGEIQLMYGYGHDFSEWTWTNHCFIDGVKERTCSRCGEKETETLYARGYHDFSNWSIIQEATCTVDGRKERTCTCGEKETMTIKASHQYEKGICTKCGKGVINIKLPSTPLTVHRLSSGKTKITVKVTSIRWEVSYNNNDGTKDIKIYWSGEKTYDANGNNVSSSCWIAYKLYDSNGYVVKSGTDWSTDIKVGEKFKDANFVFSDLDPNESYTLEILNYGS